MLIDDKDATFACIFGGLCDVIKWQPLIVVYYRSLEQQMHCKYVNNQQCGGPAVPDAINKIAVLWLSNHCNYLCVGRWARRNIRRYCWQSMWCNKITTVNSRGLSVVITKILLKICKQSTTWGSRGTWRDKQNSSSMIIIK